MSDPGRQINEPQGRPWRNRERGTRTGVSNSLVPPSGPQGPTRWFLRSSERGSQLGRGGGGVQCALPAGLQSGEGVRGAAVGGGDTQHPERETESQRQGWVSGDEMNQTLENFQELEGYSKFGKGRGEKSAHNFRLWQVQHRC